MAIFRLDSNGGAPVSPYATWADAAATLAQCVSAGAGSDDLIMVHTGTTPHVQSGTSAIDTNGPTSGAPLTIMGVDKNSSDTYLQASTYLFEILSGSSDITFDGSFALKGLWMRSASDDILFDCDYNERITLEECKIVMSGLSTDDLLLGDRVTFKRCVFDLGANSKIQPIDCRLILEEPTFIDAAGSQPLIEPASSPGHVTIIGADLNASNRDIWEPGLAGGNNFECVGCVAPTSTDLIVNVGSNGYEARVSQTDTLAGNDQWTEELHRGDQSGAITLSSAVYRDNGTENNYDGTNKYSLCMEAGTVTHLYFPTYTDWYSEFVTAADGLNVTAYVANATGTLQNDDIWLEVEYFSATASTLKTIASSRVASLIGTPANLTSDGVSTWTGISETAQKITLPSTIDVKKNGMVRWRMGYASTTTIYVCPEIEVA